MWKPSRHSVGGILLAALVGVVYGVTMRWVTGHIESLKGIGVVALGFLSVVPFAIGWISITFAPREIKNHYKQWMSAGLLRAFVFDVLTLLVFVPYAAGRVRSALTPDGFVYDFLKRIGAEVAPLLASQVVVLLLFRVGILCLLFAVPITLLFSALGGVCSGLLHRRSS